MGRKRKNGVLIDYVVEEVIKEHYISSPFIQRRFQVSYTTAQKVLNQLEEMGYIEKGEEFMERKVLKHSFIQ